MQPRVARSARLDPEELTGLALTVALVLIFGGGIVLAALAVVVRDSHALSGIDSAIADWGNRHATAFSTSGLKLVTDLGETWMAAIACVVVALVDFRLTRNRWVVPFLLAVVVGDKLLTNGLKTLVDRVRPDLNPVAQTLGPSFPSGHTSTAAALWAAVALVAWRWWGRRSLAPLAGPGGRHRRRRRGQPRPARRPLAHGRDRGPGARLGLVRRVRRGLRRQDAATAHGGGPRPADRARAARAR